MYLHPKFTRSQHWMCLLANANNKKARTSDWVRWIQCLLVQFLVSVTHKFVASCTKCNCIFTARVHYSGRERTFAPWSRDIDSTVQTGERIVNYYHDHDERLMIYRACWRRQTLLPSPASWQRGRNIFLRRLRSQTRWHNHLDPGARSADELWPLVRPSSFSPEVATTAISAQWTLGPLPQRKVTLNPRFLTLWRPLLPWVSECPDVKNYKWRLNPVWHRMLYGCTHMATVSVKGFITIFDSIEMSGGKTKW